jgi:hypothetical protein
MHIVLVPWWIKWSGSGGPVTQNALIRLRNARRKTIVRFRTGCSNAFNFVVGQTISTRADRMRQPLLNRSSWCISPLFAWIALKKLGAFLRRWWPLNRHDNATAEPAAEDHVAKAHNRFQH